MKRKDLKDRVGDLRFSINGNLIVELGEESISNPNVAIAELIKNSYDADSTQVSLDFSDLAKQAATIKIEDDGVGMDYSIIKERFMEIGSPHKQVIYKTAGLKRVPVGAKGIGRFASHSLGGNLKLETSVKGEKFGHELDFDWSKFNPSVKATDIDIPTYRLNKRSSEQGTSLTISNLKENWNDDAKLKSLLKDLQLLVSPIDPPKKFKIKQNVSLQAAPLPKLKREFFDKAAYSFKIRLTKRKELNYDFYKLGKLIKRDKKQLDKNLSCGDVSFDLFFYYKAANSWRDNTGSELLKKDLDHVKAVLGEYGGIKLYRDHFRVKPYGDSSADWIGLDKWSRDASDIPGNTNVLGIVSITKEGNPKIEDTTTREGVINNSEYYDLVEFVTTSIREFASLKNSQETGRKRARGTSRARKTVKVEKPKVNNGGSSASRQPPLIDVKGAFPSSHYAQVVFEANECHEHNYPNAAFWSVRKIIENLVADVLCKKYPNKPDLWYDTSKKRVLGFSQLVDNLFMNKSDFTTPKVESQIAVLKSDITQMRRAVNSTIHNNYDYLTDRGDLKKFKINKIIQTLVDIYAKT